MYVTKRSRIILIMDLIGPENHLSSARKLKNFYIVYSLASAIIDQSAPNMVKILITIIRSWISSIMGQIGLQLELTALELEQMPLTHSHTMTPFDAPGKQAF